MDIFDVFRAVEDLLSSDSKIIIAAVDGDCSSGKTTLAEKVAERYGANVFHADDFFLPAEKRTRDRLSEPGGNMDRERLLEEVVLPLRRGKLVSSAPFDCRSMSFGETVTHPVRRLNIVEGSYVLHPDLAGYYDLKVAIRIDEETQRERIRRRNGDDALKVFESRWIPMEKNYFSFFNIFESADILIDAGDSAPGR